MFARQAAIAIENALLLRRSRQLAVAQERERFAMDLHDGRVAENAIGANIQAMGFDSARLRDRVSYEANERNLVSEYLASPTISVPDLHGI